MRAHTHAMIKHITVIAFWEERDDAKNREGRKAGRKREIGKEANDETDHGLKSLSLQFSEERLESKALSCLLIWGSPVAGLRWVSSTGLPLHPYGCRGPEGIPGCWPASTRWSA